MDQQAVEAAARKEALAAEQQRVKDINAAFGVKDPAFALKAVAEGWTLEQAKALYADVLEARLEVEQKARQAAEKAAATPVKPAVTGAPPVPAGGSPEPVGKDFMQLAEAYAKEKGCKMSEAMAHIAATQQEVHRAFIARTAEPARQRRKALGIG